MKRFKFLGASAIALLGTLALASCGSKDKDTYEVGVLQYVTHVALGKATDGFKKALQDKCPEGKKVNFTVKNPEADASSLLTMANQ